MSREVGGTAVLLVGILLIRLTVTDNYLKYVQPRMAPWLIVAGVLLVLLGAVGVLRALLGPADPAPEHDHHDHDHDLLHSDRVGWLLLVPVVALLLVTPPGLGSFGVARNATGVSVGGGDLTYDPLPAGGPRPMTLLEFDQRAADRSGESFAAQPVELTGFVAVPVDGEGFQLARFQISCCAADAAASVVRVLGSGVEAPERDTWWTVTGTFTGAGEDGVPELLATSAGPQATPVDPYE